ncbi:MAG: addiction module protein [Victivallales bacterium]
MTAKAVFQDIERKVLKLDQKKRAYLAEKLIYSLDKDTEKDPKEIEKLWVSESRKRYASYKKGKTAAVPSDEAFKKAFASLK